MNLPSWLRAWAPGRSGTPRSPRTPTRPRLEALEDRVVPSTTTPAADTTATLSAVTASNGPSGAPVLLQLDVHGNAWGVFAGQGLWEFSAAQHAWQSVNPPGESGDPTALTVGGDGGVFAVFADKGLMWRSPTNGTWYTLTPLIPTLMQADAHGNLWAVMNSPNMQGVWQWTEATGAWVGENPTGESGVPTALTVGGDAGVFAVFADKGLMWRSPTNGTWYTLTPLIPTLLQADVHGNLWAVFNSPNMQGVWQWTQATGGWLGENPPGETGIPTDLTVGGDAGVFAVFGDTGLMWRSPVSGQWSNLTPDAPTLIRTDAQGDLWAVFDSVDKQGLWSWTEATGAWVPVNGVDEGSLTAAGGGALFAAFAGVGVQWRNPANGQWFTLSPFVPTFMQADAHGNLWAAFDPTGTMQGLWQWARSTGSWVREEPPGESGTPTEVSVGGDGGVFAVFADQGLLWRNPATGQWSQLTPLAPTFMQADGHGNLWAVMNSPNMQGIWQWARDTGGWMSEGPPGLLALPTALTVGGDGGVFAVFAGQGVLYRSPVNGLWITLTGNVPTLLQADSQGNLWAVFDPSSNMPGVWQWARAAGGWMQQNTGNPTQLVVTQDHSVFIVLQSGLLARSPADGQWRQVNATAPVELTG